MIPKWICMQKALRLSFILALSACSWFHSEYTSGLEGKPLPDFSLTIKDNVTPFSTAHIPAGKPFILFLYQPDCPYCEAQMEDLLDNILSLDQMSIYLVTPDSYPSIAQFSIHHRLDKYPVFHTNRDSSGILLNYFGAPVVPYMAFYNSEKKLSKVLVGKSPFSAIKKAITGQVAGHLASIP